MSSPGARQRRRRQQYQTPRSRREIVTAVLASVGIVLATALVIWLLRPGGLADRQPRSSWLVGGVIGAVALASYLVLRPSSRLKMSNRVALGGSYAVIAVVGVIAAFTWPSGLIRHTPSIPTLPTTPATTPKASSASSTTAPAGATTTTIKGATTTIKGATTVPGHSTTTSRTGVSAP